MRIEKQTLGVSLKDVLADYDFMYHEFRQLKKDIDFKREKEVEIEKILLWVEGRIKQIIKTTD